jgi:predicted Zn-dependent peptidase
MQRLPAAAFLDSPGPLWYLSLDFSALPAASSTHQPLSLRLRSRIASGAASGRSTTEPSAYRKTVTDHGVRVVTETIPSVRSVSLGVWAGVGSRDEGPAENGLSHLLEHMVFKGTRNRTVGEIARSLESLGGYLNAFTTKEHTCFYARVLDAHVPHAVEVLADLVQNPTFRRDELEKEKLVVLEELRSAEDDPEDSIHDHFERTMFPDHALGNPIIGTERNLRAFRREDLLAHREEHYAGPTLIVSAAGNLNHDALVSLVRRAFRSRSAKRALPPRDAAPQPRRRGTRTEHGRPITQAHVCIGRVSYSVHHRDRYPLAVMNTLLGEGMSSRLYQTVREKYGLAYSVYSFVHFLTDTGVFGAYAGTDRQNIERSIELVHEELERLTRRPVPRAELVRTKAQIKGSMMLGLENMSGRMMRLGAEELTYGRQIPVDTVLRRVDAVTADDIQRVARDLFRPEEFSTVVIRPA